MGEQDTLRQAPNVKRMKLLGAEVIAVTSGSKTLKDATSEAIRYWVTNVETTHYIIGSAVGPFPYPTIVREMQKIIGVETKKQILEFENRKPNYILACVGGGSNAIGIFEPFIDDAINKKIKLIAVEAAGHGVDTDKHAASISKGKPGVLHGAMSYLLQDEYGQVQEPHSVSAGLDYPGIGPEHSYFHDEKIVEYVSCTDQEAIAAFKEMTLLEGIIPALETAHAIAYLNVLMPETQKGEIVVLNLSGRGDKDLDAIQ
jgi:tryptophan synthase beta chain